MDKVTSEGVTFRCGRCGKRVVVKDADVGPAQEFMQRQGWAIGMEGWGLSGGNCFEVCPACAEVYRAQPRGAEIEP